MDGVELIVKLFQLFKNPERLVFIKCQGILVMPDLGLKYCEGRVLFQKVTYSKHVYKIVKLAWA